MPNLRDSVALFLLRRCAGFDAQWYLRQYPDVADAGIDPHAHYYYFGAFQRRRPSPRGGPRAFSEAAALLVRRGINPVLHETYGPLARLFVRRPPENLQLVPASAEEPPRAALAPPSPMRLDWVPAAEPSRGAPSALDLPQDGRLRVTAIVPCYNSARYIAERLRSVLWQRWPIAQLLVLDDASTDDTLRVLEELEAAWGRDLRIRVNAQNSGSPFTQWQAALPHCVGDLVWIAEADDVAHPDLLSSLVPGFENARVGLAYANSLSIDPDGMIRYPDARVMFPEAIRHNWQNAFTRSGPDFAAEFMSVRNCIPSASAVLFRREQLAAALARGRDALSRLRLAGDWLVYVECMRDSDVFFTPRVLNATRRHPTSHTFNFDSVKHLTEVAQLQSYVGGSFANAAAQRGEAIDQLAALARTLQLGDLEALAATHPPLQAAMAWLAASATLENSRKRSIKGLAT